MTSEPTMIHPSGAPREGGRWSHASSIAIGDGRLVFVAGQTARKPDGSVETGEVGAQLAQVYENLGHVLRGAGASFGDVVSLRTFLTRREDVEAFSIARNELHARLFPEGVDPPNTLVVVEALADPAMLIEVEATAVDSA